MRGDRKDTMKAHTIRFRVGSDRQTVETVLMLGPAATLADVRRKLAARGLTSPNQFPASAVHVRTIDPPLVTDRLEHLRTALRAQCISYGELNELQNLAAYIDPGDVELLEAAGVPEHADDDEPVTLTFQSTITGEEGPVTMTVDPADGEDEPDCEPTPADEEGWDAREDFARGGHA